MATAAKMERQSSDVDGTGFGYYQGEEPGFKPLADATVGVEWVGIDGMTDEQIRSAIATMEKELAKRQKAREVAAIENAKKLLADVGLSPSVLITRRRAAVSQSKGKTKGEKQTDGNSSRAK